MGKSSAIRLAILVAFTSLALLIPVGSAQAYPYGTNYYIKVPFCYQQNVTWVNNPPHYEIKNLPKTVGPGGRCFGAPSHMNGGITDIVTRATVTRPGNGAVCVAVTPAHPLIGPIDPNTALNDNGQPGPYWTCKSITGLGVGQKTPTLWRHTGNVRGGAGVYGVPEILNYSNATLRFDYNGWQTSNWVGYYWPPCFSSPC